MKAKEKRWCEDERIFLKDVLPLNTPLSIQIEASSICNFSCSYCFQSSNRFKNSNSKTLMSITTFNKIIDDLRLFDNKLKSVVFARDGEPMLNKCLPEMIEITKKSNVCENVKVITNGSLLMPDLNYKLIKSGLDILRISLNGINSKQYKDICGVDIDIEELIKNIHHFYKNRENCKVFIKILDSMVERQEQEFFNLFGDICDEISIEKLINIEYENGNKNMMNEEVEKKVNVCSMPFYSINIAADGTILPCCGDYYKQLSFGNINEISLFDYWNSEELKEFLLLQLKHKRFEHATCKTCVVPTYTLQRADIIDGMEVQLIEKIISKATDF